MIQVLTRTFAIFQELSRKGECSLEELACATRLNKGTLCNILRTLIELDCVAKSMRGCYRIGKGFYSLARNHTAEKYKETAQSIAESLAKELGESVVISTLRNDRVEIISQAQAQVQHHLMVNPEIFYNNLSLYHSVSGRILYSFLPLADRMHLFEIYGAPLEQWDGYPDFYALEAAAEAIRADSLSVMTNLSEGIKSFAIPLYDHTGCISAALGVTLPIFRLPAEPEKTLLGPMRNAAGNFRNALTEQTAC